MSVVVKYTLAAGMYSDLNRDTCEKCEEIISNGGQIIAINTNAAETLNTIYYEITKGE